MSSSIDPLTEELQCSICLEVFTDPVSTSCGHSFCKTCLNKCWDNSQTCSCPYCKETFNTRPDLKINTTLQVFIDHYKKKMHVLCDICEEGKQKALKLCLVCQSSYCETHLEPHLRVAGLKKHKLMDPVSNLEDYICQKHERPLELFCKDKRTAVCLSCTDCYYKTYKATSLQETQWMTKDVQEMIQEKTKKIKDIKCSAEDRKINTELEKVARDKVFADLIYSIERCQTELQYLMERQQTAAEKQEEKLIEKLEQEITELKIRNNVLERLSHTEDHLHLLQIYSSLCSYRNTSYLPEIRLKTHESVETLRTALTQLQNTLHVKLQKTVLRKIQQNAVNVTLDPDTAYPYLILSDDRKQVTHGDTIQRLPNSTKSFERNPCVLGKVGYSSRRFYFEVEVGENTDWTLGVAKESIDRKTRMKLCPGTGCWVVNLSNGNEYKALYGRPVSLDLRVTLQRVGVFVDYEDGLVSFHDVESGSHIYSFTGQHFTDTLYPFFCTNLNSEGENSNPLTIKRVNHR